MDIEQEKEIETSKTSSNRAGLVKTFLAEQINSIYNKKRLDLPLCGSSILTVSDEGSGENEDTAG